MELCFVTTGFGGFGSAVVFELADYFGAIILRRNQFQIEIRTSVIAFSREQFDYIFQDKEVNKTAHEINARDFVEEYRLISTRTSDYFPRQNLYLILNPYLRMNTLEMVLDWPRQELEKWDIKDRYQRKSKVTGIDVFVSYSSKDQVVADQLVDALKCQGIKPWIATRDIGPGDYPEQIIDAIDDSKIFLVLISEHSLQSRHVQAEINHAFNIKDLIMIPFLMDDAQMNKSYSYYLGCSEMIDGKTPPMESRIENLCCVIREKMEG